MKHLHLFENHIKKLNRYKSIIKYGNNHTSVFNAFVKYLVKNGIKYDYNKSRSTSSIYLNYDYKKISYKIRFANHSKALDSFDIQYQTENSRFGILLYDNNEYEIEYDMNGLLLRDIIIINNLMYEYSQIDFKSIISDISYGDISNFQVNIFEMIKNKFNKEDDYGLLKSIFYVNLSEYKNSDKYKSYIKDKLIKKESQLAKKDFIYNKDGLNITIKNGKISVDFNREIYTKGKRKRLSNNISYKPLKDYMNSIISKEEYIELIDDEIKKEHLKKW